MNDSFILSKDFPLQQRALHQLAIKAWNNAFIKDEEFVFILSETEKLIAHRDKVVNSLPQTLSGLPKPLKSKLINSIFCLPQAYTEAATWEERCQTALPFTILSSTEAREYGIDNFIDPSGHFMELEWAKRFVYDENQLVQNRFVLACFYCFEEAIVKLWSTMKTSGQLPCEGQLPDFKSKYPKDDLVVIWAYQLENKFDELMEQDSYYDDGFYSSGLIEAIVKGHEYAARFFWNLCSEKEKNDFFETPEFGILTDAAEGYHSGLVNFIYSLLKEQQKLELISYTVTDASHRSPTSSAPILSCLLKSRYYESVLNDIFNPYYDIPTNIYQWILISLSFEIAELQIARHELIFKEIWIHLPKEKREKILEGDLYIIMNLVKSRAMNLLKMIVLPLCQSVKNRMLLNDWLKAGVSALDEFSYLGDCDALRRYLLFFLVDYCPVSEKTSMRNDASSFFGNFINGEDFINFTKSIPDSEQKALNKVIEELKDTLKVPHQLLEQV